MENNIALVSFIKSYNYGACLQGYALWYAITHILNFDGDCKYVNYKRDYKKDLWIWFLRKIYRKVFNKDDSPSYSVKELLKEMIFIKKTHVNYPEETNRKFEEFWNMMPYTDSKSRKKLKELNSDFDIFIVGSDQVWNPGKVNLDSTFLLDFADDSKIKCSYASSLGITWIPDKYKSKYRKYLNRFKSISLREQSSVEIIKNIISEDKCIDYHCDPTFLLDFETWKQIATSSNKSNYTDYILIYDLTGEDKICKSIADVIAKKKDLKVVIVSQKNGDGPLDWVQLFANASYIVTNSFHGTAFSINFSKEFISLVPSKEIFVQSKDRILDLLKEVGLEDRLLDEEHLADKSLDEVDSILENIGDIDYSVVQEQISKLRHQGLEYLNDCMKE